MAYTTIDDPTLYFQIATYTGNGGTQNITNDGNADLKPDWVWVKGRGDTNDHKITDSNRLASGNPTFTLESNTDIAEFNDTGSTTAYLTDGFSLGNNGNLNSNTSAYVAWQWKANGGTATATASESGNNPAYSTQANPTAGFSIITYTGTGANSSSVVPHGLGVTPELVIVKRRDGAGNWVFESSKTHNSRGMYLNVADGTAGSGTDVMTKTSTNLEFVEIDANRRVNHDGETFVAYCFASIKGYSKIGNYTGNGSSDGVYIHTGFKPRFIIQKQTDANGEFWMMKDSAREPFNQADANIYPNASNAEVDTNGIDFLSNGFKCRTSGAGSNANTNRYFFWAIAESPFVGSDKTPTTAK